MLAAEMLSRAREALPQRGRGHGRPILSLVVAGAPSQELLRPAELEDPALARELTREALFGTSAIFRTESGTEASLRDNRLELEQDTRSVALDQLGTVLVRLPADEDRDSSVLPVIVEEFVRDQLHRALSFAGWLLDRIDPTHRLQEVAPLVALSEAGYLGWRTREDHRRNPRSVPVGIGGRDDLTVTLHPPSRRREVLHLESGRLAEDFTVLLRREKRQ